MLYSLPRRPASIGQVLDAAVLLFKASFSAALVFTFIAGVLNLIPNIVLLATEPVAVVIATARSPLASRSVVYWSVLLGCSLLGMVAYAAAMARAESIARGARIGIGVALALALRRGLTLVLATICYFLAFLIGLAFLVIPGLILMVSLGAYMPAIVVDNKGLGEALNRSHTLVWGNWWRTSALLTVGFIFIYVLLAIIEIGIALFTQFLGLDQATQLLVQFVSATIMIACMMPFANALMLEIYRDLKLRKQGGDLEQRLAALRPQSV